MSRVTAANAGVRYDRLPRFVWYRACVGPAGPYVEVWIRPRHGYLAAMDPERSVRQADPDLGFGVTVAQIADHLDTAILGDLTAGSTLVRDIDDDSRTIRPGDAYLAIPGRRWHGLDFERDVAAAGAVLVISDRPSSVLPSLVVDEPRRIMGPLTSWFHGE